MKNKLNIRLGTAHIFVVTVSIAAVSVAEIDFRERTSTTVTNVSGSITKTFAEKTVSTNGNFVTIQHRETVIESDDKGNILESSMNEYVETHSIADDAVDSFPSRSANVSTDQAPISFMGLTLGDEYNPKETFTDEKVPEYLCARFTPKVALDGFSDYFVYLTPKSGRIARIVAVSNMLLPFESDGSHYLIDAISEKYGVRPIQRAFGVYAFHIGENELIGLSMGRGGMHSKTRIEARDFRIIGLAMDEYGEIRKASLSNEEEIRKSKIKSAIEAF